jgi:hypothetical protein
LWLCSQSTPRQSAESFSFNELFLFSSLLHILLQAHNDQRYNLWILTGVVQRSQCYHQVTNPTETQQKSWLPISASKANKNWQWQWVRLSFNFCITTSAM